MRKKSTYWTTSLYLEKKKTTHLQYSFTMALPFWKVFEGSFLHNYSLKHIGEWRSMLPVLHYIALAFKLAWASQVLKEFNFSMDAVNK